MLLGWLLLSNLSHGVRLLCGIVIEVFMWTRCSLFVQSPDALPCWTSLLGGLGLVFG